MGGKFSLGLDWGRVSAGPSEREHAVEEADIMKGKHLAKSGYPHLRPEDRGRALMQKAPCSS